MGIKKAEFWRMTPLDFYRMRTAYRRRQETQLMPFRRLEAALWNVQIAKTKDGKQIKTTDLYELEVDNAYQPKRRNLDRKRPKVHYSEEEYQAIHDFFNS